MKSILFSAIVHEVAKSPLTVIYGDNPAAVLDIKNLTEDMLGFLPLIVEEITGEFTAHELKTKLTEIRNIGVEECPHLIFTNITSPVIASISDILIKAEYYDNNNLNQGPRLIELSIEKAIGYGVLSGESLVVNPFE